jgi:hypothetical protein
VLVVAPGEQRRHLRRRAVPSLSRPQWRVRGVGPPRHAADGPGAPPARPRGNNGGGGQEAPLRQERTRRAEGWGGGGHWWRLEKWLAGREGKGEVEMDGVLISEGERGG